MPNDPSDLARVVGLLDQLSDTERQQLSDRMRATGRDMFTITPDELAEWIDQLGPVIAGRAAAQQTGGPEDWAELAEFLDDTLPLSYQGSKYRLQAADIDTGLECQMLLGVGIRLSAGGKVSRRQRDQLDDAEETELFIRLLGGRQWLTEPLDETCPVCGVPDGTNCVDAEGFDAEGDVLDHPHDGRGTRDPRYRSDHDVWKQLHDEGRSWAFVQHIGTTAIFWAALGTEAALEYWKAGGRPKAAPTPPPAPRQPQDRKVSATTTPKPGSGSSTTRKQASSRKGTGGRKS